jgi:hypothetical protein
MSENKKVIPINKYNYKNITIEETVKLNNLNSIDFEKTDSYLLYESNLVAGNENYKLEIFFDQGRKTTNYLHPILSTNWARLSLGFSNNIAEIRKMVNEYISRHVNR